MCSGAETSWFLAAWPTMSLPSGSRPTQDGHDRVAVDGQHLDFAVPADSQLGIGGAKVYADDMFAHKFKRGTVWIDD